MHCIKCLNIYIKFIAHNALHLYDMMNVPRENDTVLLTVPHTYMQNILYTIDYMQYNLYARCYT